MVSNFYKHQGKEVKQMLSEIFGSRDPASLSAVHKKMAMEEDAGTERVRSALKETKEKASEGFVTRLLKFLRLKS